MADYQALAAINVMAAKHFRDERLSMKGIPPKLRGITDAYLESKGIEVKVEPISILDADFQKQVGNRSRTKTKAAEVEHAIRHHLNVELTDDPDLQASFAEALAAIFNWGHVSYFLEWHLHNTDRRCYTSSSSSIADFNKNASFQCNIFP